MGFTGYVTEQSFVSSNYQLINVKGRDERDGRISVLDDLFIQLVSYSFAMCDVEIFERIKMMKCKFSYIESKPFLK